MPGLNTGGRRRSLAAVAAVGAVIAATLGVVPGRANAATASVSHTALVSVRQDSALPDAGASSRPAVSANGAYVAFVSTSQLNGSDTNEFADVYRRNISTGAVDLASVSATGLQGNGTSHGEYVAISDNGSVVVFSSDASNLVAGDTNGRTDIFRKDFTTGAVQQVNIGDNGVPSLSSQYFSVSADGNKVAFFSENGLDGGQPGVYIRDFATTSADRTTFVHVATPGHVAISGDGTKVVYQWDSPSVSAYAIYLTDLVNTEFSAYNLHYGLSSNNADPIGVLGPDAMSHDGNIVALWSDGDAFNSDPGPDPRSVYYYDHAVRTAGGPFHQQIVRVSQPAGGGEPNDASAAGNYPHGAVSADGNVIVFTSLATNLTSSATGGAFAKNRTSGALTPVSIDQSFAAVPATDATISPAGNIVAFTSTAAATSNDSDQDADVFLRSLGAPAQVSGPVPANLVLDANVGAVHPGFTSLPSENIPATAIPLGSPSKDDVAGVPLRSVDIAASPLRSVPLRSVPLRSVPLRSVPLRSVTLSDIPLRSVTWESILGTLSPNPFVGVPLQNITLDAVMDAFDAQPSADGLNSITIGDIDLASTPLRSVAIASLLLGSTPLRSVPLPGPGPTPFDNWCALVQSLGFTCASLGLTQDSPILSVDLAGIPLRSVPLRSVPLRSVDLSSAPLRSVPLRSVFLDEIELGTLPISKIDPAKLSTLIDCSLVACATATLGQADAANAIVETATLGTLFDAVNKDDLPGSLADLLQGFIDTSNYPWETLPLPGLAEYADSPRRVLYTVSFDVLGSGSAESTIAVQLPPGFRYEHGSVDQYSDGTIDEPVVNNEQLVFSESVSSGNSESFSFSVYAGFTLGTQTADLSVTIGTTTETLTGQAPVRIAEEFDDPLIHMSEQVCAFCEDYTPITPDPIATAPIIEPNVLVASHIGTAGDVDYYRLPVPEKGTRIQVRLGNHSMDTDFDVAMLNGTESTPLRSVPLRSVPLRSVPLADNGVDATAADSALSPETLNDIPAGTEAAPLRSVSENRSTADEFIATVSDAEPWVTPEGDDVSQQQYYTLQVTAFNGGHSAAPYVLYVKQYNPPPPPTCSARTFAHAGEGTAGIAPELPEGLNTLYLVNQKRLGDTHGAAGAGAALEALRTKLTNRADLGVIGAVYPVESDASIAADYASWDADPCSPEKANEVFSGIADIVDAVRAQRPSLKNIVVIGGDDIVPFARVADYTQISNESDYVGGLLLNSGTHRGTPLAAAAATQNILTDDPLGDTDPIAWLDHTLYVPDLAIGRVVETPGDIIAQVNQFDFYAGKLDPKTSLTTGYDFLTDGANAVDASLTRIPQASRQKIINETWTRSDALTALFPAGAPSPDVASVNAHYDHYRALPAAGNSTHDESDLITSADVAAHPQTLTRKLIFTMGCHGGLPVPAAYSDDAAKESDFVEGYLGESQKAAVYFANTGFGYGDTAAVALSELLMAEFAKRLDGSMTVGEAGVYAKQAYFGQLGAYGPYDEKAMQEATFFGFPMWRIEGGAPAGTPAPSITPTDADGDGVYSANVSVAPTFTPEVSNGGGTYYKASASNAAAAGVQVTQYRPIVPRLSVDVTPAASAFLPENAAAHGVFLTSLHSTDVASVPAVARPTIDLTANEPPPPAGDVSFPTTFNTLTQFNTPDGPRQHAVFLPGQFFRDAGWSNAGGVQRLFDSMAAEVRYSNSADWTPPQLTNVVATLSNGSLTITLDSFDDDTAGGVRRVGVLVKDGTGNWTLHPLTQVQNTNQWTATFPVVGDDFEYMAQSEDFAGNVGLTTNKGRYYTGVPTSATVTPPKLVTTPGKPNGTNGWHTGGVNVELQGTQPGVSYFTSVDGGPKSAYSGPLTITADGAHTVEVSGSDGSSAMTVVVIDKANPTITATADRAPNQHGWYNAPLTVTFSCADATSGVRTCPNPTTKSADGAGQVTGTAVDYAGHQATASVNGNLDQTPPTLTINGVADGAEYTSQPTPSCTSSDGLSGSDGCTGTVSTGSLPGTYTYVAIAKDKAGNTTTGSVTYRIKYVFSGFLQPVNDTAHQVDQTHSVFAAGSTVPLRFQLRKADGTLVQANSTPVFLTPKRLNPVGGTPTNEATPLEAPSSGYEFTYDAVSQTYRYNWKTDKRAQGGYYWKVGVLLDGVQHTVVIGLK